MWMNTLIIDTGRESYLYNRNVSSIRVNFAAKCQQVQNYVRLYPRQNH